ncbi:hypothetical protein S40288_04947 [Stachybotrys chartarum IBT 40288]|nr:hypothetical protein S40288_04947 [Stachybotrys chartarum IBT 40288]
MFPPYVTAPARGSSVMDQAHHRQRSTSYGSLQGAYRVQSDSGYAPIRPSGQRRPLRSVDENSAFLRSPGPLESMLKTTTETGDIGIFSISPSSLPATTYRPPSHSRNYPSETRSLPRSRTGTYDDGYCQDDRRWLPSYRDTTSEIISLYTSDTQPSHSRSFSPTLEDSRRSYSLTTCSSRHMPSHKSCATIQSQCSASGMQRPRSPFPYPTRLKRPGVRPSSPALTESGIVDYSRMVELDRVSHRTIHGSYRPTYNHPVRRPLPASLRSGPHSTVSLPSQTSPGPYQMGYTTLRARTPNYSLPRTPRPSNRYRAGYSTEASLRSASLTSIVEMYNRPVTDTNNELGLRPAGSFYYDYSEGFEPDYPPEMATEDPLCPIPQRAGSRSRPFVLREDSHMSLNGGDPEIMSDYMDSQDHNNTALELISEEQEQRQEALADLLLADERHRLMETSQPLGGNIEQHRQRPSGEFATEMTSIGRSQSVRVENIGGSMTRSSTDPSLHGREAAAPRQSPDPQIEHGINCKDSKFSDPTITDQALEQGEARLSVFRKGRSRNYAAAPTRVIHPSGSIGQENAVTMESRPIPLLSPKPVSPARQLKVKQSIPQLMKALPPIPPDDRRHTDEFTERSAPNHQQAGEDGIDAIVQGNTPVHAASDAKNVRQTSHQPKPTDSGNTPIKFKVRVKPCSPPVDLTKAGLSSPKFEVQEAFSSEQNKLRLKISRTQLKKGRSGQDRLHPHDLDKEASPGHVTKVGSLENVSDRQKQEEAFLVLPGGNDHNRAATQTKDERAEMIDVSDQFDLHFPRVLPEEEAVRLSKSSTKTLVGRDSHGSDSEVELGGRRGLRKKMSLLRIRIPRRQAAASPKAVLKSPAQPKGVIFAGALGHEDYAGAVHAKESMAINQEASKQTDRIGGRVKRWASDAKRVMRLCVRRTLDGHPQAKG